MSLVSSKNLLDNRLIRSLVQSRWLQLALFLITSVGYGLAIMAGLFGSEVGSANFATIYVWLVWWGVFVIFFLPLFGRLWCAICPIPILGEWIQRGSVTTGSEGTKVKLSPKFFPAKFKNMWISNILFFVFAVFAGKLTTDPRLTAVTLVLLVLSGTVTAVKYRERSFCKHVCPIGGSIGLYSQINPLELRVKEQQVCKEHTSKDCVFGNDHSYGCPWMEYPGTLSENTYCGLCMECVRACDLDNITLNFRPLNQDILRRDPKLEEVFRALLLFGIAVMYPAVFFGTWNWLTALSNFQNPLEFILFSLLLGAVFGIVIPAVFALPVLALTKMRKLDMEKELSYSLVMASLPLGLAGLISFTLQILSRNFSYAVNTLNDPFGAGWRILGISPLKYQPLFPQFFFIVGSIVVIVGMLMSFQLVDKSARKYLFDKKVDHVLYRGVGYVVIVVFTLVITFLQYGGL